MPMALGDWRAGGLGLRIIAARACRLPVSWGCVVAFALFAGACTRSEGSRESKPNIVFILADDIGYGDVHCFNPEGKIPTPNLDRLAEGGVLFTDAHSASSVCTPTRYGILTGRYAWRTALQHGVTHTGDDPLIAKEMMTVQRMLKQVGYHTACIGKWHLGFHLDPVSTNSHLGAWLVDGPLSYDFDLFLGFHHAGEMEDWMENEVVKERLKTVEMLPRLCQRSVEYIETRAEKKDGPFFLYVPLNAPHVPFVPSKEWQGRSGLNIYGDFVMQMDDVVGEITRALERSGLSDQTLVIFTGDNGVSPRANMADLLQKGHDSKGGLRGGKSELWEGGHRMPLILQWPDRFQKGKKVDSPVCLNGFLATCAELIGYTLPDDAGVDSFSWIPFLRDQPVVDPLPIVHHSSEGKFAIRSGPWKFIASSGSGGWGREDGETVAQLYNLSTDRGEETNLIDVASDEARRLYQLLEETVQRGRTRAGLPLTNDVPVNIWKSEAGAPEFLK